jgi:hypothetical protein
MLVGGPTIACGGAGSITFLKRSLDMVPYIKERMK